MTYQRVGAGSALCSASASYYQSYNAFSMTPQVGDQIFFYISGGINHTGIVESIENNRVITIEGNSSDEVKRNTYILGSLIIAGYGHPNWDLVAQENSNTE